MNDIRVLDQKVANMIAAGEVVERPASVVKELVENAIDANAQSIIIEIKNGGISYIRVTDNGRGIARGDAVIAFERHATSKINAAEDLDNIHTLGFRGEALASIAAVAHVELITRNEAEEVGTHVVMKAGRLLRQEDTGCPKGTTIIVKNLFFNIPARMKFLKKDSTEAGYIGDVVNRMALGHPEISFRYINNGKEAIYTPGDNQLIHCVYSLYGKDYAKSMLPIEHTENSIKVWGMVGKANIARANRSFQSFYINGRYIKSSVLSYAIEEAYKNLLMINRHPVVIIHIFVNPTMLDVNVHPNKMEVKFSDDRQIYQAVYWAVKNALYAQKDIPTVELNQKNLFKYSAVEPKLSQYIQEGINTHTEEVKESIKYNKYDVQSDEPASIYNGAIECEQCEQYVLCEADKNHSLQETKDIGITYTKAYDGFRIIGQIFNTYIIIEKDQDMLLIDQHAAHERLKYEQLTHNYKEKSFAAQTLLVPVVIQLSNIETETFKENFTFFNEIGFEIENFGNNSVIIRQTPITIEENALKDLFLEIIELLQQSRRDTITDIELHALYTIACKSAVKANQSMHLKEMERLVEDILKLGNVNTCPHGRPVIISLSKYQIEKEFKRVGK